MKGQIYHSPPPNYLSVGQVTERLGMSRQGFHQSGLAGALDRWQVGRMTLYQADDVARLRQWLTVRQGLIALGILPANQPLNPPEGLYAQAVEEGYWDAECPQCQSYAVADPIEGPVWCPRCGIQNVAESEH